MSHWEQVTVVVHSRNRPEFLLHLIDYYNKHLVPLGVDVVISDGSDDEVYSELIKEFEIRSYPHSVKLIHHSKTASLPSRFAASLELISTPYLLLAADDDLYYFDWIESGVAFLNSDPSYGVVYGHCINFELKQKKPYGELVGFGINRRRNPAVRWLEGDSPKERLVELGRSAWATAGWYALQRVELLAVVVAYANQHQLDGYHVERLLIFCQAALSKSKMIDQIYIARQTHVEKRNPYSYREEQENLGQLIEACVSVLCDHMNIEKVTASRMVEDVFKAEIVQLESNDARKILRALADYFPILRTTKSWFFSAFRNRWASFDPLAPDSRFPVPPLVRNNHPKVVSLRQYLESRR